ncbi:MAG TPA: hypothetical protein VG841_10555 [Caulobacterales bacterium]|nr:hypothetical protein [Caulobacterales bacterium]
MSPASFAHEADFVASALQLADSGEFESAEPILIKLFAQNPEQTRKWFGEHLYEWVNRRCARSYRTAPVLA